MRALAQYLHTLYDRYSARMNMVTIVIHEAHAADEWALQGSIMVNQPRTTAERIAVATRFRDSCSWRIPLWIDPPDNGDPFETAFAPWPLRFYIVRPDRTLAYIADPVDETYDLIELENQIKLLLG